jgi:flavin reductase (DIM6/NTAB) family NADH-FMN oxidoreductase RutF
MRVDFDPQTMDRNAFYKLLTAVVVPRPIAWISTLSESGSANLAPHSFFTISSVDPPILQFTSVGRKDTLRNIEATRQFVVNFTPEELFEQVNATATNFPHGVSEFDAVGIDQEPSRLVKPPRVAASPVALECELHSTVPFGDSTVVFGRILNASVREAVIDGGHPGIRSLRPLARLGGNEWSTVGEVLEIERISFADWPGSGT